MLAGEQSRGALHAIDIERLWDVPGAMTPERRRDRRVVDEVSIRSARRVPPRVERLVDLRRAANGDGLRQPGVEPAHEYLGFETRCRRERRHLAQRVHAGVGAPGKGDAHAFAREVAQGSFELALDGGRVLLELGAGEGRAAVVLEDERDPAGLAGHSSAGSSSSRAMGAPSP